MLSVLEPPATPRCTYINNTPSVAREEKLSFLPFVVDAFVEDAGQDLVVGRVAYDLFQQHSTVQRIKANAVAPANHNFSGHVVDSRTLHFC